jgi:hypothetical protein
MLCADEGMNPSLLDNAENADSLSHLNRSKSLSVSGRPPSFVTDTFLSGSLVQFPYRRPGALFWPVVRPDGCGSRVTVSAGLASTPLILSWLDRDHRTRDLFRCGSSTALRWRVGPVRNRQCGHLVGAKRPSGVLFGGRTTRRPCRIPLDRRRGGWRSHPRSWPWQCHGSPLTARTRHRRSSGPRDDRPHEDDWKTLCTSLLP